MWCDRPPFTLQCFFEPWTHCASPHDISSHEPIHYIKQGVRPKWYLMKHVRRGPAVLRAKLSWLLASHHFGWGHSQAKASAVRFLFRPRNWVRKIATCLITRQGFECESLPRFSFATPRRRTGKRPLGAIVSQRWMHSLQSLVLSHLCSCISSLSSFRRRVLVRYRILKVSQPLPA